MHALQSDQPVLTYIIYLTYHLLSLLSWYWLLFNSMIDILVTATFYFVTRRQFILEDTIYPRIFVLTSTIFPRIFYRRDRISWSQNILGHGIHKISRYNDNIEISPSPSAGSVLCCHSMHGLYSADYHLMLLYVTFSLGLNSFSGFHSAKWTGPIVQWLCIQGLGFTNKAICTV